jgi:hypothetical protein
MRSANKKVQYLLLALAAIWQMEKSTMEELQTMTIGSQKHQVEKED